MRRAVILDDEIWAIKDIERLLSEVEDFEVVLATTDADEAEEILINEMPEVLFTDIKMPGRSGLDCAAFVKKNSIPTLVVIISGYDDYEYMHESIRTGVFDYLLKPVMQEEFNHVIERIREVLPEIDNASEPHQNQMFTQLLEYVNANFNRDIKLSDVARSNFVSERYVAQLFSRHYNMSFLQYLTKLRMERAKKLLLTTQKTISEISREVGYSNGSYFNKVFKKYYNQTPNTIRKNDENE